MKRVFDNTVLPVVILIVLFIIIPLPTFMLDLMILANIAVSLLVLLITMYIKKPLDFPMFPSLLLITALFRLALAVSCTRLILGNSGNAGQVVKTLGEFIAGENIIAGLIVFLIILIIQYIVITKGAERASEASAKFVRDTMPDKQSEAEFYRAVGGATKFVKGDAIAALIMAVINIAGGITTGIILGVPDFLEVYSTAAIGSVLALQISALLVSTATGMIVTRAEFGQAS